MLDVAFDGYVLAMGGGADWLLLLHTYITGWTANGHQELFSFCGGD
jgi:hypothetical protein